jgi:hypothetical protein
MRAAGELRRPVGKRGTYQKSLRSRLIEGRDASCRNRVRVRNSLSALLQWAEHDRTAHINAMADLYGRVEGFFAARERVCSEMSIVGGHDPAR